MNNEKILIVGAGIEALITAFHCSQNGMDVEVIAKNPDPRRFGGVKHQDGSTWRGSHTRYITQFEGQPYLEGEGYTNVMYPAMKEAFEKPASEGGWLGKELYEYSENEGLWLAKRNVINGNLDYAKSLFDFYMDINKASMNEWFRLQETHQHLFKSSDVLKNADVVSEIVRVYDRKDLYEYTKQAHERYGVLLDATSGDDIILKYPHLAESYKNDGIKGGVLKVKGFSFNIHKFSRNLIDYLEQNRVKFNFGVEAAEIERSPSGIVKSILTTDDKRFEADHYSLHMGAYNTNELLKDTSAENAIAGVAGGWVHMKAPAEMKNSLKIHGDVSINDGQKRAVVDQNHALINVDRAKLLVIGGGYLFSGFSTNISKKQLGIMNSENERIIKLLFPTAYDEAYHGGNYLRPTDEFCVRGWTYDDMPRLDVLNTEKGGKLVISGGTNTGTTTSAHAIAKLIIGIMNKEIALDQSAPLEHHDELRIESGSIITEASKKGALQRAISRFKVK